MVKIQSKKITKEYKKRTYRYTQHLMPFPLARNEELEPFLKRQLKFKMNTQGDMLNVSLKKESEVKPAENT